jgi:hypothetical protein
MARHCSGESDAYQTSILQQPGSPGSLQQLAQWPGRDNYDQERERQFRAVADGQSNIVVN